jgi:hypothetical protein
MSESIAFQPIPSLASLLPTYPQHAPSLRLTLQEPRPRSWTDFAIRGRP